MSGLTSSTDIRRSIVYTNDDLDLLRLRITEMKFNFRKHFSPRAHLYASPICSKCIIEEPIKRKSSLSTAYQLFEQREMSKKNRHCQNSNENVFEPIFDVSMFKDEFMAVILLRSFEIGFGTA